jgi:hypothetical protein
MEKDEQLHNKRTFSEKTWKIAATALFILGMLIGPTMSTYSVIFYMLFSGILIYVDIAPIPHFLLMLVMMYPYIIKMFEYLSKVKFQLSGSSSSSSTSFFRGSTTGYKPNSNFFNAPSPMFQGSGGFPMIVNF